MKTSPSHPKAAAAKTSSHGTTRDYAVGFALSCIITTAAFATVMAGIASHGIGLAIVVALCVAQLLVQLVYFMHIGTSPDKRENAVIFSCTALLIVVMVGLSLWVMHNANVNMMPTHMSAKQAMLHE